MLGTGKAHVVNGHNMLCQHPGKGALRCCVLQSSGSSESPQPVRIVPGVFVGFLLKNVSAELHLLVKYGIDFFLCDMASKQWYSP